MSNRITVKDLDRAVIELNSLLGYTMGQEDSFCLHGAYGGWQLQQKRGTRMVSITSGYHPKRELYQRIFDMRQGIMLRARLDTRTLT